jgi:hypothetical protein
VPVGAAAGLALLLSIGVAQWIVLRRHLPRAARWIVANALAWIAALPIPFAVLGATASTGAVVQALAGIAAGAAMGAVVAAVTGQALLGLLRLRAARAPAARGEASPERAESEEPPVVPAAVGNH